MKISRLLKILEDLVALKFSDPRGKHGRRFYRNLHRILRAFLSQDGLPLKTRLRALTPSMAVYAKVRTHEQIDSDDVDKCIHFIVLEVARVLLETEYLRLKETDPSKCLFLKILQQTKQSLKSSPDGRMFEALGNVLSTEWNHPVLLKMVEQEHSDSETIPYAAFIESVENSDIVRLRVRMLLESGCVDLANNLISWCIASGMFNSDIYILLQRLDFLHRSGRAEEFHQLCCQISCCTARKLLDSVKQGTSVSIGRSTLLSMSRTFFLLDWMKATDLSCTRELLKHWMNLEYATVKKDRQLAIEAFNKVIALSHDIKQLVLFVDVIDDQFGSEFQTFCSELMLQAIRQERHRLDCARLYRRDAEEVRDATENLVSICRIIGRIYKDHCQMNLSCTLGCIYLDPTVADFCSLQKEYANLECPPSTEPDPPPHMCASVYRKLLSAVQFLRPDSFAVSSMWTELKPVLVTYMEDEGFRYNDSKDRFRSNRKQGAAGKHFGSRRRNIWKGMNNADTEVGFEAMSSPKKEAAKVGDGSVRSGRLKNDPADKELKAGESNKRKQNSDEECSLASHGGSGDSAASSEPLSKRLCRLPPNQVSDPSVDVRDAAGESGGENSTDSAAVSEHSSGPRWISGSEIRRRSLLGRRYVWNSSASANPASGSNPQKLSSHTAGKSDKETARQNSNDFGVNLELRSTCGCLSSDGGRCSERCSNVGSNNPCISTAGRLDKNSNLHVESTHNSSTTSLAVQNGNEGSCSSAVEAKADGEKENSSQGGSSSQGGWESKFLAYCSFITESEVEIEQSIESVTVATTNETVATTNLSVATTNLAVATSGLDGMTSTSIALVSCANSSTSVVPCMAAKSGTNTSLTGLFESLSSPKVAYISKSPRSCSSKSSEFHMRRQDTSRLVVDGAEPSQNSSLEMVSHEVKSNPTAVEDFGLNSSAIAMTNTCQPSIEVATLNDKASSSNCALRSKEISSDTNSDRKVMLHPTASEVDSCRKFAKSCTNLFAKTTKELSATSDITRDISEPSVSRFACARKIASARTQGDILRSSVPVSSNTVDPSLVCTTEKPTPPPTATSILNLTGLFPNGALNGDPQVETTSPSICPVNGEPVLTSTFSDSHSVASSNPTHSSSTSFPVEASSVTMAIDFNELMTSGVVCSYVPVMEEVWSASSVVEPQSVALTDGVTYSMYELELESVLPITMTTDTTSTITPDSAAGSQTITIDEMNQVAASPHDVTTCNYKTYLDDYAASGGVPVSDTTLVASRSVMEMLETIDQTVTCNKTKRHSVAFVQKLKKIFKPDSETNSRSPGSSRGSDIVETSVEPNAAKRIDSPEDHENENASAVDVVGTKLAESLGSVETSGNNVLNKPAQVNVDKTDSEGYEKAYPSKANVSKHSLSVGLDCRTEFNDTRQKLSEALNPCDVCLDLALDLTTNSNPISRADTANIEMINVETDPTPDVQTDVGQVCMVNLGMNSTPNLQSDDVQTDQSVDGQLVDMSIFNALENEQQLLIYNRLRQETERNEDTHHTLAVIRFSDQTVPVSPSNRLHYERANPKLRDMLSNSLPCGFDAETCEGDVSYDARNGSGQKVESVASGLLTVLDGSRASDGLVKGEESLEESEDVGTVSGIGKPESVVRGLVEDIPGKGPELCVASCHMEGHVGDDSVNAQGLSMEPFSSGGKSNKGQSNSGKKLNKGKHPMVENSRKARCTVGRNSDKVESRSGRKAVKDKSPVEEKPSVIHNASSVDVDKVVCVLCGKSLSFGRSFRTHVIKLHKMDFVDWRAPEDGYRCRLCDLRWKSLSVCTCQQESTSKKPVCSALSSKKALKDSSENFTSCRKKIARRSSDRKSSLDGNSDCERSIGGQTDDQSTDRSRSGKGRGGKGRGEKDNGRPSRGQCNTRSKETKKGGSQKIDVSRNSKAINKDNDCGDNEDNGCGSNVDNAAGNHADNAAGNHGDNDGVTEGSSDRPSRKRLICGGKKKTNDSSVKKRNVRELSDNAESSVHCRPRKRHFGEGDREKTEGSVLSAHRGSGDAGEDSGRGNDVEGAGKSSSSQKRWRLRDRLKVKTE